MAYADLTDEQRKDIARYDAMIREAIVQLMGVFKGMNVATLNQFAAANVDPYVSGIEGNDSFPGLADNDVIPNPTGLANAKDLTVAEFKSMQTLVRTLQQMAASNIGLIVKAVGVNAK